MVTRPRTPLAVLTSVATIAIGAAVITNLSASSAQSPEPTPLKEQSIHWGVLGTGDGSSLVVSFPGTHNSCLKNPRVTIRESSHEIEVAAVSRRVGSCTSAVGVIFRSQMLRLSHPVQGRRIVGTLKSTRYVDPIIREQQQTVMPNLRGLRVDDARSALKGTGFASKQIKVRGSGRQVQSTRPAADTKLAFASPRTDGVQRPAAVITAGP